MNWKDVPIPEHLQARPRDERGFPIPVTVGGVRDGKPVFTLLSQLRQITCIVRRRCGLCGQRLDGQTVAVVGGTHTAALGIVSDPPMHVECALYAVQVCPFLVSGMRRRIEGGGVEQWGAAQSDGHQVAVVIGPDYDALLTPAGTEMLARLVSIDEVVWS